jgi:hypothetical protein
MRNLPLMPVALLCSLLPFSADAQTQTRLVCEKPDQTKVQMFTSPGGPWLMENLTCGQEVILLGTEGRYSKIRLAGHVGYVLTVFVSGPEQPPVERPRSAPTAYTPPDPPSRPDASSIPAASTGQTVTAPVSATKRKPAPAKEARPSKYAPLPEAIFEGRTVFLDNQSGHSSIADRAYDELRKWGRFKVVTSPRNADLVFLLSAREYLQGYVTTGSVRATATTQYEGYGRSSTDISGQTQSSTEAVVSGRTFLTVIDPKDGVGLWSDSMQWGRPVAFLPFSAWRSATRGLIKSLRDRMEAQRADGGTPR